MWCILVIFFVYLRSRFSRIIVEVSVCRGEVIVVLVEDRSWEIGFFWFVEGRRNRIMYRLKWVKLIMGILNEY